MPGWAASSSGAAAVLDDQQLAGHGAQGEQRLHRVHQVQKQRAAEDEVIDAVGCDAQVIDAARPVFGLQAQRRSRQHEVLLVAHGQPDATVGERRHPVTLHHLRREVEGGHLCAAPLELEGEEAARRADVERSLPRQAIRQPVVVDDRTEVIDPAGHDSRGQLHRVVPALEPGIASAECFFRVLSDTGATGLEPAASGVTGRRSNQLSYAPRGRARSMADGPAQLFAESVVADRNSGAGGRCSEGASTVHNAGGIDAPCSTVLLAYR